MSWIIEEAMLQEYFLLVRRIQGISLSVQEYWDLDTWTTAFLLDTERKIIEAEQEAYDKDSNKYNERPEGNSEEMNELMDMLQD